MLPGTKHHLEDPCWRGSFIQHAPPEACSRLDSHRIACRKRAGSSQRIFCQIRSAGRKFCMLPRRNDILVIISSTIAAAAVPMSSTRAAALLFLLSLLLGGLPPCPGRSSPSGGCQSLDCVALLWGEGVRQRGLASFRVVPLRYRPRARHGSLVLGGHQC